MADKFHLSKSVSKSNPKSRPRPSIANSNGLLPSASKSSSILSTTVPVKSKSTTARSASNPTINPAPGQKVDTTTNLSSDTNHALKVLSWNIKRGLIKRELEIINLLEKEQADILFLNETDTMLDKSECYTVQGFKTVLQKVNNVEGQKTQIIALIKEGRGEILVRENLMNEKFPSIWIEVIEKQKGSVLICSFYREWNSNGNISEESQIERLEILISQIELANTNEQKLILIGDLNLCSLKWRKQDYVHKAMADGWINAMDRNGMESIDTGVTYTADQMLKDGSIPQSSLDHIYLSQNLRDRTESFKGDYGSLDYLQIGIELKKAIKGKPYSRKITKRCMKGYNKESWLNTLWKKDWSLITEEENIDKKVKIYSRLMKEALDDVAPVKSFTIRSKYRFGLSQETKDMMVKRNNIRKKIHSTTGNERKIPHAQYKTLRNKVNGLIKDSLKFNSDRIEKAKGVMEDSQ